MRLTPGFVAACLAALLGLALADVRPAWAGCENQCNVSVEPPLVEPPAPSCVQIHFSVGDCNCSEEFTVYNGCDTALLAKDFTFSSCGVNESDCTVIEPGSRGNLGERLEKEGPVEWIYTLESSEGEHRVTLRANVKEFVDPGCAIAAGGGTGKNSAALGTLVAALLLLNRRRRPS